MNEDVPRGARVDLFVSLLNRLDRSSVECDLPLRGLRIPAASAGAMSSHAHGSCRSWSVEPAA